MVVGRGRWDDDDDDVRRWEEGEKGDEDEVGVRLYIREGKLSDLHVCTCVCIEIY